MNHIARVVNLILTPYSDTEVGAFSDEKQRWVREYGDQRVVKEEEIEIVAMDESELQRKILELVERLHPKPIIVRTESFPESYVVGKQYHHADKRGIFEAISYHCNPDHPFTIAMSNSENQRKEPEITEDEIKKRQQFIASETPRVFKEALQEMMEREGAETFDDFIKLTRDAYTKAFQATNDHKEAIRLMQQEHMKRYYEHEGRGAYVELNNPKKSLDKTTILFRVIGKDVHKVSDMLSFYLRHLGTDSFCMSNSIADATVSFTYRKNLV